jgi:hypothetical protein
MTQTATDAHFESLQFVRSSGAWDSAGRRFVFSSISRGRPVLSFFNVQNGRLEREVPLPQLDEAFNPTWSPDGRLVALSGLTGGLSDIFIYSLESGELRRMTADPYADLQPTWSPDGARLAFVTDRFSSELGKLAFGSYRLASMDVATAEISPLPAFEWGKAINPQWSPDSASLYFLSDRSGITNLYRLELASGASSQVTDLRTGASGLTASSPALSVAAGTGALVLSVYAEAEHRIYLIDSPERLTGRPLASLSPELAVLPPREGPTGELAELLQDMTLGLPVEEPASADYRPRLSLDYVGQPYVLVGANRLGSYFGGGISFLWSAMLGDHTLATTFQVSGGFADFAGQALYVNRKRRWNWAAAVEQIPFLTGTFARGRGETAGEPVLVEQFSLYRQTYHQVLGIAAYPFDRARRVELAAGYSQIGFPEEVKTTAYSLRTGRLLFEDKRDLPSAPAIHLAQSSAALVQDTSLFGATSPILGSRFRFEASPTLGSLSFVSGLADYRRYLMPRRPYTIAVRLLHLGRYGPDGEHNRLQPLFIGYPSLVRGYDTGSFSVDECEPDGKSACPAYDQLLGSKALVANLELRFPLLGALRGEASYGPLPIEAVLFWDAGVAWQSDD